MCLAHLLVLLLLRLQVLSLKLLGFHNLPHRAARALPPHRRRARLGLHVEGPQHAAQARRGRRVRGGARAEA